MTTTTLPDITIKIGDIHYIVDVSKTLYLSSLVHFQANAQPQSKDQTSSLVQSYQLSWRRQPRKYGEHGVRTLQTAPHRMCFYSSLDFRSQVRETSTCPSGSFREEKNCRFSQAYYDPQSPLHNAHQSRYIASETPNVLSTSKKEFHTRKMLCLVPGSENSPFITPWT